MAEAPRPDNELQELLGESGQDELWLVSYADLLTLLLAFFVLIIASSVAKPAKFEQMAASIAGAPTTPLGELKGQIDDLVQRAQLMGRVTTREDSDGLGIEFKDALIFDSGSAKVRSDGHALIAQVAGLIREFPTRALIIEGHTDDMPIHTPAFASNWELSTQRAINVLNVLAASGVPRDRMSVRGFADTRPLVTDGPLDQRRLANRRVVIRVE